MINKEDADEKVEQGWLRTSLMFEVLAIKEEVTEKALGELIGKLDKDGRVKIYKKELLNIVETKNPFKDVEKAYSQACEIELIAKNFEHLVEIVTEYGPSSIEILEPNSLSIGMREAQSVLNRISSIMHQFAKAGVGGLVFIRKE
jgi:hypothetical protein